MQVTSWKFRVLTVLKFKKCKNTVIGNEAAAMPTDKDAIIDNEVAAQNDCNGGYNKASA